MSATVTPTGVREGDPAALAALCAVRGPSVVAYCRHVAGGAEAGSAAADAFARFRVAVVAAGDTTSLNPEALLISATRTSAAARADITAPGHCAHVPALLAARAEKTLPAADLDRLEAHLEGCWACRAPVARFKAAERAYRDPPEKTVDPALSAQIVEALIAAVPPAPPPPEATALSVNGSAPVAEPEPAPAGSLDQPTEHFAAADMVEPEIAEGAAALAEAEAAQARTRRRAKRPAGGGGVLARLRSASSRRGPREQPRAREAREAPMPSAPGVLHAGSERSRPSLRLALVLPIVLVLLALLAALYVSGVFGGKDPESSPSVSMPAAPGETAKPAIVPGARDASADAVETAKARARGEGDAAAGKRKRAAAKPDSAKQADAPAAASPPPAAAPPPPPSPAVSANNPVTRPPPPERDTSADEQTQIDAGSGATGAEQIPPPADASGVPDLAPPPESATP